LIARIACATETEVKAELMELEIGIWPDMMIRTATFLRVRETQPAPGRGPGATKEVVAAVHKRIRFWSTQTGPKFAVLTRAANRLLGCHVTTCAAERNWSAWGRVFTAARNRLGIEKAMKLIYIKANGEDSDDEVADDEAVAMDYMD
jgi:hypothetical protein